MRVVLIGDGQFQLFKSLDLLTSYVEPLEADSGEYLAYSEDGKRWRFAVTSEPSSGPLAPKVASTVALLDGEGEIVKRELLREVSDFSERCGNLDLPTSFEDVFDAVEHRLGFT